MDSLFYLNCEFFYFVFKGTSKIGKGDETNFLRAREKIYIMSNAFNDGYIFQMVSSHENIGNVSVKGELPPPLSFLSYVQVFNNFVVKYFSKIFFLHVKLVRLTFPKKCVLF